jgi:outer membrane receptor protein involved in Fe transport
VNITYNLNKKNLIRLSYGKSVNRPEFREIAPFYFFDFELNAGTEGDPEIRQAYIHNFDIRYEMYPDNGELFTIGAFYKKFKDPIEQIIKSTTPTRYSFQNVEAAYCYGVEAELRKSLGFIPSLDKFTFVLNASLIKSQVLFDENYLLRDRPLEGQSPFIVNTALFYQSDKGLMISLLYNVIGKRISAVGIPSPNEWDDTPNIYEMPRNVIDLTFSKTVGKNIEIKGGIKDILNEEIRYVQPVDATVDMSIYTNGENTGFKHFKKDQVTRSFRPGSYFSLGVTFKF